MKFRHGSLFTGFGGFDIASEWMGWENIFHCEKEIFCQRILKYYWPNAKSYGDICTTDFTVWRGLIDILTGGFPCQPYSEAGLRKGTEDSRHLWPEMLRCIRQCRPTWILGENVIGLISWNEGLVFEQVQTDLENEGYEVQSFVLPAASIGAPHRRDRVWIVAYSADARAENERGRGINTNEPGIITDTKMQRNQSRDGLREEHKIRQAGGSNTASGKSRSSSNARVYGQQSRGSGKGRSAKGTRKGKGDQWEWLWNDDRGTGKQGFLTNAISRGLWGEIDGLRSTGLTGEKSEAGLSSDTHKPGRKKSNVSGLTKGQGLTSGISDDRNSSNANEQRLEGSQGQGQQSNNEATQRLGWEWVARNTGNDGLQRTWEAWRRQSGSENGDIRIPRTDWNAEWPTVSPICGRDDGFPDMVDSIAFFRELGIEHPRQPAIGSAKWRNETIKGYGNAVVPHVPYQIYQVIEQMMKLSA